jgi:Rrf2 family transcriptional regulator, iron-sulfur cluster assembly transcription factor
MCEGGRDCQDGEECLTHHLWTKLGREIFDFLNGITLASFIERDDVNEVIQRQQGRVTLAVPR